MTITINIPNSAENRLRQEADRMGVPIPSLIEGIVVERFGSRDFDAFLDAMAAHSDELVTLAPEATTRAGIYSGSD